MNAGFQRRIQRYGWDKAGHSYEEFWQQQLWPAQSRLLEMADLREGERVVDIACGTGLVTLPAAAAVGSRGSVVGLDISQKMVEIATERADGRARFERAEAEKLGVDDESFDAALCSLGLMYVPNPLDALAEMRRVLVDGGRAVVSVWGNRKNCGWAEIFPIVDARVQSQVCPMFFQLGTADLLRDRLEQAGFADIEVERMSVPLQYDSAESALGAAFAGGPVALAYSKFDETTRDQAHTEYLESIEAYRDGDGYVIPGEFVVATAWKGGRTRNTMSA